MIATMIVFVPPSGIEKAEAASSSVTWSTYSDFNGMDPQTDLVLNGSGSPSDANSGSVNLSANSSAVTPDFGTGAISGTTTISGSHNINEYGAVPNFENLMIATGANLYSSSNASLEFKVSGTLTVNSGGTIHANGRGGAGGGGGGQLEAGGGGSGLGGGWW